MQEGKSIMKTGGDGAKIGFLLAVSYYLIVGAFLSLTDGDQELALLILTGGVFVGAAIGFIPAAILGFVTGLIAPELIRRLNPKTTLQAALAGLASCLLPAAGLLLLLVLLGHENPFARSFGTVFLLWIPLAVYFTTAAYVAVQLAADENASSAFVRKLIRRPLVWWLFVLPLLLNIAVVIYLEISS